jgi:hypothetical protein
VYVKFVFGLAAVNSTFTVAKITGQLVGGIRREPKKSTKCAAIILLKENLAVLLIFFADVRLI